MHIAKINSQSFAGNIKIHMVPDGRVRKIDANEITDLRPYAVEDDGYVGCIFEVGDKTYKTERGQHFYDYRMKINEAKKIDGTIEIKRPFFRESKTSS